QPNFPFLGNDMRRLPPRIRLRRSLAAACSFACGPLRAAGPPAPPPPDTLWLQNAGLRLGFDPRNGSLLDLTDRATGQAFVLAQGRFPRLAGIPRLGDDEELAVPRWMGALARNSAALKICRLEWAYPGTLSLQMLALYRRGGGGLYAAADDTLAYRKTFALWGEPDGSRGYELIHPLENPASPRVQWTPAYAALLGTFRGDWITADE